MAECSSQQTASATQTIAIEVENNTMPSLYQGAYMMSQGSSFKAAQFMGVVCAIVSG